MNILKPIHTAAAVLKTKRVTAYNEKPGLLLERLLLFWTSDYIPGIYYFAFFYLA